VCHRRSHSRNASECTLLTSRGFPEDLVSKHAAINGVAVKVGRVRRQPHSQREPIDRPALRSELLSDRNVQICGVVNTEAMGHCQPDSLFKNPIGGKRFNLNLEAGRILQERLSLSQRCVQQSGAESNILDGDSLIFVTSNPDIVQDVSAFFKSGTPRLAQPSMHVNPERRARP